MSKLGPLQQKNGPKKEPRKGGLFMAISMKITLAKGLFLSPRTSGIYIRFVENK